MPPSHGSPSSAPAAEGLAAQVLPGQAPAAEAPARAAEAPAGQEPALGNLRPLRGVITDWGGVMTNPIGETMNAWLEADGIDRASYVAVMRPWLQQAYATGGQASPVHALERGECALEEFEQLLAGLLVRFDGQPVVAEGLLTRMFAATILDQAMVDLMRALRRAGVRTALLSNSWGGTGYPRELFPGMFDAVVISAEVGMRKPEQRIFRHTAELLGLWPEECVFIDDIEANVLAAQALGLTAVQHQESWLTVERLTDLLGVQLT